MLSAPFALSLLLLIAALILPSVSAYTTPTPTATASATPSQLSLEYLPFLSPALVDLGLTNSTCKESSEEEWAGDLRRAKRDTCPQNYSPCSSGRFCCRSDTVCQTDFRGQVACCPQGAACTGIVPSQSVTSAPQGSTIGGSYVLATTAPNGGGVMVGSSTVAFVAGTSSAGRTFPRDALGFAEALARVFQYWRGMSRA